jgi:outer membrane protein
VEICNLIKEHIMKRSMQVGFAVLLGVALAAPTMAHEAGQWIFRAGVGQVAPKSNNLTETVVDQGTTIDVALDVDDGTSLTLMGTYMFTQNWGFDILASWPFKHDVNAGITIDDGVNPALSFSGKIAEVKHLPPTFSVQYHFLPDGTFQPYAGLGVNYTTFTSEKFVDIIVDGQNLGTLGDSLSLDDSFGVAAQVGGDWMLNDNWLVNLDVRWISIESDMTVDGLAIGKVKIDPWVYSLNVGYRF